MLSQRSSTSSSAAAAVSNWRCQFLILGLFYIVMQCDARAVNVSNTWTMPQEGLNVFYRFFRDRISWFEADAVCQFHHANLVTVDNSFQFDATRDLLRELDVNDIVWIGLMRPQSSDRFMWSNSRPLVADTGYWAESLPLMDAPLCAVIDPIRDYRWHALRCGGPETASFLCEMPVPNWADTCILKDMPNLTMQYMADTASIELIRNCQEEGLLRTTCRGKQDRDRALQDLICPRERLEAQRINDITNSHFKSLQIINSIPSDNNENNDIELLPMDVNYAPNYPEDLQTEKNTVQRLIEQFNVDDLMQADEPANMETVSSFYKIPGLIPKPVKKSAKKVLEYPKKDASKKGTMQEEKKARSRIALEMDDMMLGDQPQGEPEMSEQILNEEVSNEILEPLPHIKKTNIHKEEAEKMDREVIAMKESMQKSKEMQAKKLATMKSTTTTTTTPATTEKATSATMTTVASTSTLTPETSPVSTTTSHSASTTSNKHSSDTTPRPHSEESPTEVETTHSHVSTTLSPATIGHPMHPQQPRTNVNTEDTQRTHVKESADNSHFIPPMLLVKSHYVPPTNKHGHSEHHSHAEHLEAATNEDVTETTKSRVENNGMMMTTPKVIDLDAQTPTSMSVDANHEKQKQQQQRQQELNFNPSPVITEEQTTENGNMKPITLANDSEQEQRKNAKYRNLEEATATATTTTLPPLATTKFHSKDDTKDATLQTTTMKFVEGNLNGNDDNTDDTAKGAKADDVAVATKTIMKQELKPQTDIETETTQTTKLVAATAPSTTIRTDIAAAAAAVATTEQKHDLMTETTQATATTQRQMEYVKATREKSDLTLAQQQHQQQQTNVDHEKLQHTTEAQKTHQASTKTTATILTTTDAAGSGDQATETTTTGRRIILATNIESTQKTEISGEMKHKEEILAASEGPRDKKETFATTTEVLTTKTSTAAPATASVTTTLAPSMSAAAAIATTTTTTATATVQPTTETIANTSISKTSNTPLADVSTPTITTTTTASLTTTTAAGSTTTSTSPPSISPSVTSPADTTTTTTDAPASEASPETTRNFLKVTTEMPFKPNRRRSLTKPDTVSYMKKILG